MNDLCNPMADTAPRPHHAETNCPEGHVWIAEFEDMIGYAAIVYPKACPKCGQYSVEAR